MPPLRLEHKSRPAGFWSSQGLTSGSLRPWFARKRESCCANSAIDNRYWAYRAA